MRLNATLDPSNASNQQVMWISSDPSIATVDQLGNVEALTSGEVTITLLSDEAGHQDQLVLKINKK